MADPSLAEVLARRRREGRGSLLVYFMVDARRTRRMRSLAHATTGAGAAGIELGFPFSDPIADGPVLQAAAARSLVHRTVWTDLLDSVAAVSEEIPCAVMTYANPVFQRGLRRACRELRAQGATALIVPDLSFEESGPWRVAARQAGLALVQMGSPASSPERMGRLARGSEAFLYMVARFGTTGRGTTPRVDQLARRVGAAHSARPELPVLVGFGVRDAAAFRQIRAAGADGAVVGTPVEEMLAGHPDPGKLERFVARMARAGDARDPRATPPRRRS